MSTSPSASSSPSAESPHTRSLAVHVIGPILAMVPVFLFASIGHEVNEDGQLGIDRWAHQYVGVDVHSSLYTIMTSVSWFAGPHVVPWLVLAAMVACVLVGRFRPDGVSFLVAAIGGLAMIVALKAGFHRARPDVAFENLGYSYPSGHSFFAVILYGLAGYHIQRHVRGLARGLVVAVAFALVLLVGYSRVALGEHFLTDVIGGYALAVPWLWACIHMPRHVAWMRGP